MLRTRVRCADGHRGPPPLATRTGLDIGTNQRAHPAGGDRHHPRHCLCGVCPPSGGSVAGDWVAERASRLRAWLRLRPVVRDADGGLAVPSWVIEALAEPDLHDAGR